MESKPEACPINDEGLTPVLSHRYRLISCFIIKFYCVLFLCTCGWLIYVSVCVYMYIRMQVPTEASRGYQLP